MAIKFEKVQEGDVLYDCHRHGVGNVKGYHGQIERLRRSPPKKKA